MRYPILITSIVILFLLSGLIACSDHGQSPQASPVKVEEVPVAKQDTGKLSAPVLDTIQFKKLNAYLAHTDTLGRWPAPKLPVPLPGAILPFHRIVAYYGNLYSKNMGILGELPKADMIAKLQAECAKWQAADSMLKVKPALHYIAVTAQGRPGADAKYRLRMASHQIDTVLSWAREIDALTFVDIQVGHSSLQSELPALEKYLQLPDVHLGIDPEFSMKGGDVPGKKIGTFDAADINYAVDYLASLVRKHQLPPKVLVVHRFTQGMITNYQQIRHVPEVQIVINMDGWGPKILKKSTWLRYILREPIEYTGFKIFYKNDTKQGAGQLYQPEELVQFTPRPVYIQYQ